MAIIIIDSKPFKSSYSHSYYPPILNLLLFYHLLCVCYLPPFQSTSSSELLKNLHICNFGPPSPHWPNQWPDLLHLFHKRPVRPPSPPTVKPLSHPSLATGNQTQICLTCNISLVSRLLFSALTWAVRPIKLRAEFSRTAKKRKRSVLKPLKAYFMQGSKFRNARHKQTTSVGMLCV